jgi:hypothetical protein
MDATLITALIAGIVSFFVSVVAHLLTRKRDRESDWRKLKLEAYREYVLALSGVVHQGRDVAAQRRYADAVNSFILIAPPNVLKALYAFQDEISYSNTSKDAGSYEVLFCNLARLMRLDCHPGDPHDATDFVFRTVDIPPSI